jgi:glomulin
MAAPIEKLVDQIDRLLTEQKFDECLRIINDPENLANLKYDTSDLFRVLFEHINDENFARQPKVYFAAEELMVLVCQKLTAEDSMFELLVALEQTKSDEVFTTTLKGMQKILQRITKNKARAMEWCLNTVQTYIAERPLPELLRHRKLDQEEDALLETDPEVEKLLKLYVMLLLFVEPIQEMVLKAEPSADEFKEVRLTQRNVLVGFYLQLLGKPFAFMNFTQSISLPSRSYFRENAEKFVANLNNLLGDPFFLLPMAERHIRWPIKSAKDGVYENAPRNCFLLPEKTPLLSMGVFYYLLLAEDLLPNTAPKIYSPAYVFDKCLYLVVEMIGQRENSLNFKGIALAKSTLARMGAARLSADELELPVHVEFCKNLTKLIVYSDSKHNRQLGLELLRDYILQFEDLGRYLLIKNLLPMTSHNGLVGYLGTMYKNMVADHLNAGVEPLSGLFSGQGLRQLLLDHICHLKHGKETDLIENSDSVIAGLNTLRFLLLRDRDNRTKVWDFVPEIEAKFLSALRFDLDMARAHYKVEEETVRLGVDTSDKSMAEMMNISIKNSAEGLPELTKENKLQMLANAMNTFDMIDSLLARVNECIKLQKAEK